VACRQNDKGQTVYDIAAATVEIEKHQRKQQRGSIDPESGLTWLESKQKEQTRKLERENTIAEKVMAEEWMTVTAHHAILSNFVAKLEAVPDKLKAELGLSESQKKKIVAVLDQARSDAAAEIERAFAEAKEDVTESAK